MSKKKQTKVVHEGSYVAEVDVELLDEPEGWSPYLFEIDCSHKAALDRAEGRGKGYELETVEVITKHSTVLAKSYIATRKQRGLRPYHWYKALVVAGAVEHDLPKSYVEWLRVFESEEDPRANRRAENEAILFAG